MSDEEINTQAIHLKVATLNFACTLSSLDMHSPHAKCRERRASVVQCSFKDGTAGVCRVSSSSTSAA